jgi:hypothetical protein
MSFVRFILLIPHTMMPFLSEKPDLCYLLSDEAVIAA